MPGPAFDCTLTCITFGTDWCSYMYTCKHTDTSFSPSLLYWHIWDHYQPHTGVITCQSLTRGASKTSSSFCFSMHLSLIHSDVHFQRWPHLSSASFLLKGWKEAEPKWDGDGWLDKPREGVKERGSVRWERSDGK